MWLGEADEAWLRPPNNLDHVWLCEVCQGMEDLYLTCVWSSS